MGSKNLPGERKTNMKIMGIDMGTTTISVIMADGESGSLITSKTIEHQAFIKSEDAFAKIQDARKLWDFVKNAVSEVQEEYGKPDCIGMTGQMHGMLYIGEDGEAVSPLYTWQDQRGNEIYKDHISYGEYLKSKGLSAATGYGLTTHFYQTVNHLIPEKAVSMVTISDYIAMRLCNLTEAVIACDMAASWGCFNIETGEFMKKEMEDVGIDTKFLPKVLKGHGVIGRTADGIPVTISLGDNQASVLGSVQSLGDTVLLNIGTGSQVSFGVEGFIKTEGSVELRPCTEKMYLMAGSGLCGGRAYAMLEGFFRNIFLKAIEEESDAKLKEIRYYEIMADFAEDFLKLSGKENAWKIKTTFSGTRSNPLEKGSISGISVENFHPGAMVVGMINGILEELFEMYDKMCEMTGKKASYLVASGNGIRKNPLMRIFAEEMFGMKLAVPLCQEEAAFGAALQGAYAAGLAGSLEEMQKKIQYI